MPQRRSHRTRLVRAQGLLSAGSDTTRANHSYADDALELRVGFVQPVGFLERKNPDGIQHRHQRCHRRHRRSDAARTRRARVSRRKAAPLRVAAFAGQTIRWKGRDLRRRSARRRQLRRSGPRHQRHLVALAREWAPRMVEAGAIVIDQSSAFRQDPAVPLVVPEINAATSSAHRGIIAGPNCTTAVAIMAVAPLHRAFGVESIISSSYQAMSGLRARGHDRVPRCVARKAVDQSEALRGHEPLDLPGAGAVRLTRSRVQSLPAVRGLPRGQRHLDRGREDAGRDAQDAARAGSPRCTRPRSAYRCSSVIRCRLP